MLDRTIEAPATSAQGCEEIVLRRSAISGLASLAGSGGCSWSRVAAGVTARVAPTWLAGILPAALSSALCWSLTRLLRRTGGGALSLLREQESAAQQQQR